MMSARGGASTALHSRRQCVSRPVSRGGGGSVSGVALQHGLPPNMVHRWLREQRL